ncbi:hypothetical protein SERLA73DRAFT_44833, partial [Serpula lacrymans var. lacrymans S7.3]
DINFTHLGEVTSIHILSVLLKFVPVLSIYFEAVKKEKEKIMKTPINSECKTNIFPFATNSVNEIDIQGMKAAAMDFLSMQMNVNKETLQKTLIIFSGDGKTFEQMCNLNKKYLSIHKEDNESEGFIVPMLELWHTKWTDLSCIIHTHWGSGYCCDPSSLSCLAGVAECLTPSNLHKVNFHNRAHFVNLVLDVHLLSFWE